MWLRIGEESTGTRRASPRSTSRKGLRFAGFESPGRRSGKAPEAKELEGKPAETRSSLSALKLGYSARSEATYGESERESDKPRDAGRVPRRENFSRENFAAGTVIFSRTSFNCEANAWMTRVEQPSISTSRTNDEMRDFPTRTNNIMLYTRNL